MTNDIAILICPCYHYKKVKGSEKEEYISKTLRERMAGANPCAEGMEGSF